HGVEIGAMRRPLRPHGDMPARQLRFVECVLPHVVGHGRSPRSPWACCTIQSPQRSCLATLRRLFPLAPCGRGRGPREAREGEGVAARPPLTRRAVAALRRGTLSRSTGEGL